jgi:hypothetical protein
VLSSARPPRPPASSHAQSRYRRRVRAPAASHGHGLRSAGVCLAPPEPAPAREGAEVHHDVLHRIR